MCACACACVLGCALSFLLSLPPGLYVFVCACCKWVCLRVRACVCLCVFVFVCVCVCVCIVVHNARAVRAQSSSVGAPAHSRVCCLLEARAPEPVVDDKLLSSSLFCQWGSRGSASESHSREIRCLCAALVLVACVLITHFHLLASTDLGKGSPPPSVEITIENK